MSDIIKEFDSEEVASKLQKKFAKATDPRLVREQMQEVEDLAAFRDAESRKLDAEMKSRDEFLTRLSSMGAMTTEQSREMTQLAGKIRALEQSLKEDRAEMCKVQEKTMYKEQKVKEMTEKIHNKGKLITDLTRILFVKEPPNQRRSNILQ